MDDHTLEGLTARLEAAERGLQGARRAIGMGSVVLLLVAGGAVWIYLDPTLGRGEAPSTVEAQRFLVRDAHGDARAVLEASDGGATQLVFFRDPLPGDVWREHAEHGPFSFGIRAIGTGPQMLLSGPSGGTAGFTPTDLTLSSPAGGLGIALNSLPSGEAQLYLRDSTGDMQMMSAGSLKQLRTKRSEAAHPPAKRRHAR